MVHPLAGQPAPASMLVDLAALERAYDHDHPDPAVAEQRVAFGTSGHRGSSLRRSFNEDHIVAITEAICDYRAAQGVTGPLYVGADTHALSAPAQRTALEVLVARGVDAVIAADGAYTPTPVVSARILRHNRARPTGVADGVVITPSHNPPEDGGFKYNPPHGGPADTDATKWIENRANALLKDGVARVKRVPYETAARTVRAEDFIGPYVAELGAIVDLPAIAAAHLKIGADPMGGSSIGCWAPIAERYGIDVTVVNPKIDKTFSFMPLDHDGKIRMDCSSPYAMKNLVALKDQFDVAFANDVDADRHGIVTRSAGLMNPNHYLAVAIAYLFARRAGWRSDAAVGKTLVSSSMIDRVARALGRPLAEVPVGFKWFVPGLLDGSLGFGGEESAGASFLRMDGTVWTTDKDGILLDLLAAEILTTGKDPGEHYRALEAQHGAPAYTRIDAPATPPQKKVLGALSPDAVRASKLAGDAITSRITQAPFNGAPIGGLKVATDQAWFAARPSGTEDVYKIYAESFRGPEHLERVVTEARDIVGRALGG